MAYFPQTVAQTLYPQQTTLSDISAFYGISGVDIMAYDQDVGGSEIFNASSTFVGDECFEPTYGCDLPMRIFEPINTLTLDYCRNDVYVSCRDWVVHVQVTSNQTIAFANLDNRLVGVQIVYTFNGAPWTVDVALVKAFDGSI